jgi:hypothetical protein
MTLTGLQGGLFFALWIITLGLAERAGYQRGRRAERLAERELHVPEEWVVEQDRRDLLAFLEDADEAALDRFLRREGGY